MIYYGGNDYRDYISHYGVKGMKWGKHLFGDIYDRLSGGALSRYRENMAVAGRLENLRRNAVRPTIRALNAGVSVGTFKAGNKRDKEWLKYNDTMYGEAAKARRRQAENTFTGSAISAYNKTRSAYKKSGVGGAVKAAVASAPRVASFAIGSAFISGLNKIGRSDLEKIGDHLNSIGARSLESLRSSIQKGANAVRSLFKKKTPTPTSNTSTRPNRPLARKKKVASGTGAVRRRQKRQGGRNPRRYGTLR